MKITQRELNLYRSEVNRQADLAGRYVRGALDAYFAENEGYSTADGRRFSIELLKASMPSFCDAAGTLAVDFFDEIAEALGMDVESRLYDTTDYSVVEDKVRFFAEKLNDGDVDAFKSDVVGATGYFVKRSAFDNMFRNCIGNDLKYARVPTGFETCAFCFMLASRGFVYESERAARISHRTGDKYHLNCDCIIIPGSKGKNGDPRVKIEGYDPKTMYDNWRKCAETVGVDHGNGVDKWTDEERKAVMREVETRDWHWLYTGETPKTTFETTELETRLKGKRNRHELRTGERLAENGIPPQWQVDEREYYDEKKKLWQRIGKPDLKNGYELKTPRNAGWSSIDGYLRDVKNKEGVRAVVIDNFENENPMTDDVLIEKLSRQRRWDGPLYLITRSGKYIRVR